MDTVVGKITDVKNMGKMGQSEFTKYEVFFDGNGGYFELTKFPSSYETRIGEEGEWGYRVKEYKGNTEKILDFIKPVKNVRVKSAYTMTSNNYNAKIAPSFDADKQIISLLTQINSNIEKVVEMIELRHDI